MAIKKIPCGGFYVDDGAVQNVDGKPVLSAWNADLPKPSVGGYGYTEQGEQTTITWDGDTDGRDVLTIINSEHPDDVVRMYKVAEYSSKQFTENCEFFAAGSQFPVSLYTYDHAEVYADGAPYAIRTDGTDFDIRGGTAHAESSGVYFLKMGASHVESITYGTPDTVHKIDEKYLPESGGVMMTTFTITEDGTVATHTVEQISSAMKRGIVYAVLQRVLDGETVFICSGVMEPLLFDFSDEPMYDEGSPCLVGKSIMDGAMIDWIIKIAVSNGEWVAYEK